MRRYRRAIALLLVVAGAAAGARLLEAVGGLSGVRRFEDYTLDLRQQTTPESFQPGVGTKQSPVVLVLFDEYSVLDTLEGWDWISPFPRAHLAALVDALSQAGARTIGLDVYLDRLYPGLNRIDGGDDLLHDAMARAGNVILVAPVEQTDSGPVTRPPAPYFADVAADVGSAELPSSFETFRDGTLAVRSGDRLEPSFALALYAHAEGLSVDSLLADARRSGRISLPGLPSAVGRIPAGWFSTPGGNGAEGAIVPFRIRYVGPPSSSDAADPPGTFAAYSSSSVPMTAMLAPDLFKDKIVLLGTGFHDEDKFRTPFYGFHAPPGPDSSTSPPDYSWMFGVEVHANALENIVDGEYVTPLGTTDEVLLLIVIAFLVAGMAFWKGAGWGAFAAAVGATGTVVLAWWAWAGVAYVPGAELFHFPRRFLWVPVTAPVLAGLFAYVGSVAYVSVVEGREKRFIKGAFGKYLSPDVVAEIAEDPEALRLGGQKRPLSLLFSDLSGFTTLSEHLIALLNEYLDDMTNVVLEDGGYLDKYIGDAIMAFWNAPKEIEDHAFRALHTAVVMQRKMNELNERWRAAGDGRTPLVVRIGVHTGEVVVGNVGGKDRFNYSAIGDAVNLAARLEPANKTYGTLNMTSEATLVAAGAGRFRVRELDLIAVKGKEEPVKVFELLEMAGVGLAPDKERALQEYEAGMRSYKAYAWEEARCHFLAAAEACPGDGPSEVYALRCAENIAEPPPPDWDFVVRRTTK